MGTPEIQVDITEATSVDGLWQTLSAEKTVELDSVMMTVNHEYVKPGYVLKAGDEVAFFPPVTGG